MAQAQREALINALIRCNYSVSRAAQILRIGRSTTYRLVEVFEIEIPDRLTIKLIREKARIERAARNASTSCADLTPKVVLKDGQYILSGE
jgi:transposase